MEDPETGSSPHTRGTREQKALPFLAQGIIPAYAGNTAHGTASPAPCQDHPRIRGEHKGIVLDNGSAVGSSPHTRGTLRHAVSVLRELGIIPAYAGNTFIHQRLSVFKGDHPRIRGEHVMSTASPKTRGGSSPHTRGTPILLGRVGGRGGIIPAYAGNTFVAQPVQPDKRDHPRIRGEHLAVRLCLLWAWGSSPHTRGTPRTFVARRCRDRIIPAYAGNTNRRRSVTL